MRSLITKRSLLNCPDASLVFGGVRLPRGTHAKRVRPLEASLPIHVVLKAERSAMRLPKHFATINELVYAVARKWRVRVHQYANVGNHLHLLIRIPDRRRWAAFIRELTGRIAHRTRVRWAYRPFTRIVRDRGRSFTTADAYVALNHFEAERALTKSDCRDLREMRRAWRGT